MPDRNRHDQRGGAAVAAGKLLRLDAAAMTNALGIAGSLACGLMEFARSGTGATASSPPRRSSTSRPNRPNRTSCRPRSSRSGRCRRS